MLAGVQERELEDILSGPPVRKLLLMSDAATIEASTLPELDGMLEGTDASTTQAVDTMAEVVPKGASLADAWPSGAVCNSGVVSCAVLACRRHGPVLFALFEVERWVVQAGPSGQGSSSTSRQPD